MGQTRLVCARIAAQPVPGYAGVNVGDVPRYGCCSSHNLHVPCFLQLYTFIDSAVLLSPHAIIHCACACICTCVVYQLAALQDGQGG